MLTIVAAVGGGLFIVASLAVGGRLMWLSRRTRGLPELLLGSALFLMGGIGYPLLTIAVQAPALPDGMRAAMVAGHMVTSFVGMMAMTWFTRRVFRPGVAWATALWLAIGAGYAGLALAQALGDGLLAYTADPHGSLWHWSNPLGVVAMTWAGAESMRHWSLQRRRLALGLADPIVADRFRLFGIAILTADAISAITVAFEWAGVVMVGTAFGSLIVGTLGLAAAGTLWLAFMPTRGYLERIERRARA